MAIRRAGAPRILRASGRRSARSAPAFATRKSATSARQKSKPKSTAAAAKKGKRASDRRDEVRTPTGTFYAKRTAGGRFKEMDEKGRSLAADRRKKAKKRVGSGYGDQGDRSAKKK